MAEHCQAVRHWNVVQQQQYASRRLKQESKQSMAIHKKNELLHQKHAKAIHNLVRWDEYRERKEFLTTLYVKAQ